MCHTSHKSLRIACDSASLDTSVAIERLKLKCLSGGNESRPNIGCIGDDYR